MGKTFQLSILTPEHEFFSGEVEMLVVNATDGEVCVLPNHEPMLYALADGELRFRDAEGVQKCAAASDGFLTVTQDKTIMMLQSAEWPEDIDRVRAKHAARAAKEALLQKQDRQSYMMNQAMLLRAMTRLRVSGRTNINN